MLWSWLAPWTAYLFALEDLYRMIHSTYWLRMFSDTGQLTTMSFIEWVMTLVCLIWTVIELLINNPPLIQFFHYKTSHFKVIEHGKFKPYHKEEVVLLLNKGQTLPLTTHSQDHLSKSKLQIFQALGRRFNTAQMIIVT